VKPQPILILIGGGPGAGKTRLGRAMTRSLPDAVLIDKDVLAGGWVDAMLGHLNQGAVDRDSAVYWESVRPLEYAALLAVALDNLRVGKHVVAVAPFGPELANVQWMAELGRRVRDAGGRLKAIWVETDMATAQARIRNRADARDKWKLANWAEFSRNARYGPPAGDMLVLRNRDATVLADLVNEATTYIRTP
jgi:predicted kinase